MDFRTSFIPIGVGTFHLESAKAEFDKSVDLLRSIDENVCVPEDMLLTIDALKAYLKDMKTDLAIVQNLTFANAAYMSEILHTLDCPVLLWTLREPVIDGTRLRLNSLTGAFSAANTLKAFGRKFEYIFGSPTEETVSKKIASTIAAAKVKKAMTGLKLLQVGHTPQGFGFGRALDSDMLFNFGVTLESIEARELIDKAKTFTDEEIAPYIEDAKQRICSLDSIDGKNVSDFARLYKAYSDYVKANNIGALASRCWPDFFTAFGTPVCAVLSILNDLGIPCACEADSYGALSMFVSSQLSGSSVFFGDPVSLDEKENTITFWHCGMAPCSLAREDTGACAGLHCNRKIGPTLDFGCEQMDAVTIMRIGRLADGSFRIFAAKGKALNKPKQFNGTSIVVETADDAHGIIEKAVTDGWEPHFVVAPGDIYDEILILGNLLGIEVCRF